MRLLIKKLRPLIPPSTDDDITTFSFDGTVLKVICNSQAFFIGGTGTAWEEIAVVKTKYLKYLPKRLNHTNALVYIHKNMLVIGDKSIQLSSKTEKHDDI